VYKRSGDEAEDEEPVGHDGCLSEVRRSKLRGEAKCFDGLERTLTPLLVTTDASVKEGVVALASVLWRGALMECVKVEEAAAREVFEEG